MRGTSQVMTSTIVGTEAVAVRVEVEVGTGLPSFSIVGLPDASVQEARERVRAALRSCGFEVPNARVIVNLAPGPLRKHGTGFDLAIALGLLLATAQVDAAVWNSGYTVGELSLNGEVRSVPGVLAHVLRAHEDGLPFLGPHDSPCAGLARVAPVYGMRNLCEARTSPPSLDARELVCTRAPHPGIEEIAGHEQAKRALEIAATGSHNLMLVGPPGSGKTMLARCLPGLLPPLDRCERIETALCHSVAGLDESPVLAGHRPFRAPHHTTSVAGLVGGGSPPRPGEASLAHNGVLFLDEMPEFAPSALQALRQPMEDGTVTLVRAEGRMRFSARFALVAACNPCPCGFLGDRRRPCTCSETAVNRYANRIGGPLMDRIDIVLRVDAVDPDLMVRDAPVTSTRSSPTGVTDARRFQEFAHRPPSARLNGSELLEACALSAHSRATITSLARANHLTGRGLTRVLRVARTLADLEQAHAVTDDHLVEAAMFRVGCG